MDINPRDMIPIDDFRHRISTKSSNNRTRQGYSITVGSLNSQNSHLAHMYLSLDRCSVLTRQHEEHPDKRVTGVNSECQGAELVSMILQGLYVGKCGWYL